MDIRKIYQQTILFAALRHEEQKIPGSDIPYIVHVSNVCMEIMFAGMNTAGFDMELAVQVALLHDVLEDTNTTEQELLDAFGIRVTNGVKALSKNESLPKEEQMRDSLNRILKQPKEIWAVKLADRITNLQPPPHYWNGEKIEKYRQDAILIYETLKVGNEYLAIRLRAEIDSYPTYT